MRQLCEASCFLLDCFLAGCFLACCVLACCFLACCFLLRHSRLLLPGRFSTGGVKTGLFLTGRFPFGLFLTGDFCAGSLTLGSRIAVRFLEALCIGTFGVALCRGGTGQRVPRGLLMCLCLCLCLRLCLCLCLCLCCQVGGPLLFSRNGRRCARSLALNNLLAHAFYLDRRLPLVVIERDDARPGRVVVLWRQR